MTLHTSADTPITCAYWDELVDEDGFLALGRNRYHCSYVIYTDGTYYYAENGTTGNLDYGGPNNKGLVTGTSAVKVIQAAINALPSGTEGEIFIRVGKYPITEAIVLTGKDSITIRGENRGGSYYVPGTFQDGTYLYLVNGSNDHLIEKVEVAPAKGGSVVLQDLGLDGNCDNQTLGGAFDVIHIEYAKEFIIERCTIQRGTRNGIRVMHSCENFWIINNRILQNGNGQHCVFVSTSVGGKILNNIILGANAANMCGIYFENACNYNHVFGNMISDNYYGIQFRTACHFNRVVSNGIAENDSHGFLIYNNCDDNVVSLNNIRDNAGYGIWIADFGTAAEENWVVANKITGNTNFGVRIEQLSTQNHILDNDVSNNAAGSISDTSTGFNIKRENYGYNPVAASTPAVGASPVTYGPYAYPMYIEVSGGTVTSVTVRAVASGLVSGGWMLYPSDTCVIVYAVVPVVKLWPQ